MHGAHGAVRRLAALRSDATRDDELFSARAIVVAGQLLDERQRRRPNVRERHAVQLVTAIGAKLHQLTARRRPMNGVAGLVERETIIDSLIVHALDTGHGAAQRLRDANTGSTGEHNERDESRRETETSHGNMNTTQCRKRKRTFCPRERFARLQREGRMLLNRERRLSN